MQPRLRSHHPVRHAFAVVLWSVLYVVCAVYLIMRAEGLHFDVREVRFIETAVVRADVDMPVLATLGGRQDEGRSIVFSDVAPGEHVLTLALPGRTPIDVVVQASARRVTTLGPLSLPVTLPVTVPVAGDVVLAAASDDGRNLALVRGEPRVLEVVNAVARTPQLVARIQIPDGVALERVAWIDASRVVLLASDRIVVAELPETLRQTLLPGTPTNVLSLPGSPSLVVRTATGEVLTVPQDGSLPTHVASDVRALIAFGDDVLLARRSTLESLTGVSDLPSLPDGVRVVGALRDGESVVAWDTHGQSWSLDAAARWHPGATDVQGAVTLDGSALLRTSDGLVTVAGALVLRLSRTIDAAAPRSADAIYARSALELLDCTVTLRDCRTLLTDVDELLPLREGVAVRQGKQVTILRQEAAF